MIQVKNLLFIFGLWILFQIQMRTDCQIMFENEPIIFWLFRSPPWCSYCVDTQIFYQAQRSFPSTHHHANYSLDHRCCPHWSVLSRRSTTQSETRSKRAPSSPSHLHLRAASITIEEQSNLLHSSPVSSKESILNQQ